MNVDVKKENQSSIKVVEKEIQHTLFSVVKPENEIGSIAVFQTEEGEFSIGNYNSVLNAEIKKRKYKKIYFISNDKLDIDLSINLYSDLMESMMSAVLKCSLTIKDHLRFIGKRGLEVPEQMAQILNEQLNTFIAISKIDELDLINEIIKILPSEAKNIVLDYMQIESCRLINVQITDRGKREKVKHEVYGALNSNDLFTLVENEKLVDDLFNMRSKLENNKHSMNQSADLEKINSLENENKIFDLVTERYMKMKDSGLIPPDITMAAYMKALGDKDESFNTLVIDKKNEESNEENNSHSEDQDNTEKAYFE